MSDRKELPDLFDKKEKCCGCSACFSVCGTEAITMQADEEGFLYPVINGDACVRCGRCVSVCAFKNDLRMREASDAANKTGEADTGYKKGQYEKPVTYAVKHEDLTVRMASRSGGIFTALSDPVLESGGVVYGCVLIDSRRAAHVRAETKAERDCMRGSKYIQSETGSVFAQVRKDLENGSSVLFSGTSCQVAGLKAYLGKDYQGLLCADIVCHGVPSPLVWNAYLDWQEKINGENVHAVDFRNKQDFGWKAHVETLTFASGKKVNSEVFKKLFYQHSVLRPSCYVCPYKDVIHPGDITIADYWGVDDAAPGFNDDKGVSLVLVNNEKGRAAFEAVKHTLEWKQTRIEDSMQKPLSAPFPRPSQRDAVWADFFDLPFDEFVKKRVTSQPGMMVKLKRKIRKLLGSR